MEKEHKEPNAALLSNLSSSAAKAWIMHAYIEPPDNFHEKIAFPAFLKLSYRTAEAMYAWLTKREMYTFRRGAFWLHMFFRTHFSQFMNTSSPYSKFCSGRW